MSVVEKVQKKDIFYIILLRDSLVTVPKQWLTDDKKYTFWPSNVNTTQCINLVKSCTEVNEQWEKYEIEFIYGITVHNYNQGNHFVYSRKELIYLDARFFPLCREDFRIP